MKKNNETNKNMSCVNETEEQERNKNKWRVQTAGKSSRAGERRQRSPSACKKRARGIKAPTPIYEAELMQHYPYGWIGVRGSEGRKCARGS